MLTQTDVFESPIKTLIIMKTFIQFNQLSYFTDRELGNVNRKTLCLSLTKFVRQSKREDRSDKVKKLVKFQQIWIGPRFVASYIQIKGSEYVSRMLFRNMGKFHPAGL